jgi:hypothetical protein
MVSNEDQFENAIERAATAGAVARELREAPPFPTPADAAFLGHLIAAHGVDRESALERSVSTWRDFHKCMPHNDHGHGW